MAVEHWLAEGMYWRHVCSTISVFQVEAHMEPPSKGAAGRNIVIGQVACHDSKNWKSSWCDVTLYG